MTLSIMSDNFPIQDGTLLASRYEVQAFLGEGSFGKVAKCANIETGTMVAIKITKGKPAMTRQALEEIKILKQLQTVDPDDCNLVRWNGSFFHKNLICLEFELLDMSLLEYTQQKPDQSLSMTEMRPVIHQLTTALLHLDDLGIIHGDLKLENIMIVDRKQQPVKVKLIDFGLAKCVSKVVPGSRVQSLWYRAPEVMLGMNFAEPIDMWSLGLVAAELFLGFPLFPGSHEYDMMKFIVDTLGQPYDYQLNCGQKSSLFFHHEGSNQQQSWRLKSPEEFARQTGHQFRDTRCYFFSSLDALAAMIQCRNKAERNELQTFMDLLKKMLLVDKHNRIIPLKVLEHPFFSVEQHTDFSPYMDTENLMAEPLADPNIIMQQPSFHKNTGHSFEHSSVVSEALTPDEERVFTPSLESLAMKLEDVEHNPNPKGAHVQLELVAETSSETEGCVKNFFKSIVQAFSSCFYGGN